MLKPSEFSKDVQAIIEWVDNYFKNLESYPVKSKAKPRQVFDAIPDEMPIKGEDMNVILKDLDEVILPGITHWQHPNFHAFFPCSRSVESLFAEIITATMGVQGMIWDTSPAAAELEEKMLDWLRDKMNLPAFWKGVIQGSASDSNLVAILTAREVKTNFESNKSGVPNNMRLYCSDQVHSSVEKGAKVAGIGSNNVVAIATDENMALIPEKLEQAIEEDLQNGKVPFCVVAAFGTTGTMGIDPIARIGEICEKYKLWYHIDAAYAGTAMLLPEYHWMTEGMGYADSFVFNPHKWMFTNFDCSCYYIKDVDVLKKTFEIMPEYLKTDNRGEVNDYRDWGVPLGRRFRALKLWFVMRGFGLSGIQQVLRHHIALNNELVNKLKARDDFELMTRPMFNMCCFRYKPVFLNDNEEINKLNKKLKDAINESGEAYISHTIVGDKFTIRFLPASTYVDKKHVDHFFDLMIEKVKELH